MDQSLINKWNLRVKIFPGKTISDVIIFDSKHTLFTDDVKNDALDDGLDRSIRKAAQMAEIYEVVARVRNRLNRYDGILAGYRDYLTNLARDFLKDHASETNEVWSEKEVLDQVLDNWLAAITDEVEQFREGLKNGN